MQKKLIGVSLCALMLAAVAEAKHFDGAFLGANLGYKWDTIKLKETDTGVKTTFKPSGVGAELTGGYGETIGSVYLGGDVRFGYGWGKKKRSITYNSTTFDLSVNNTW